MDWAIKEHLLIVYLTQEVTPSKEQELMYPSSKNLDNALFYNVSVKVSSKIFALCLVLSKYLNNFYSFSHKRMETLLLVYG